MPIAEEAEEAP
jgi:hypothetical protein